MLTVLVSTISNSQGFFFFGWKNISIYDIFNDQSFNDTFSNDIISFEQLGSDVLDLPTGSQTCLKWYDKYGKKVSCPNILCKYRIRFIQKLWKRYFKNKTPSMFVLYVYVTLYNPVFLFRWYKCLEYICKSEFFWKLRKILQLFLIILYFIKEGRDDKFYVLIWDRHTQDLCSITIPKCFITWKTAIMLKYMYIITLKYLGQAGLCKQCRTRSDTPECSIWSGSTLLTIHTAIFNLRQINR